MACWARQTSVADCLLARPGHSASHSVFGDDRAAADPVAAVAVGAAEVAAEFVDLALVLAAVDAVPGKRQVAPDC